MKLIISTNSQRNEAEKWKRKKGSNSETTKNHDSINAFLEVAEQLSQRGPNESYSVSGNEESEKHLHVEHHDTKYRCKYEYHGQLPLSTRMGKLIS